MTLNLFSVFEFMHIFLCVLVILFRVPLSSSSINATIVDLGEEQPHTFQFDTKVVLFKFDLAKLPALPLSCYHIYPCETKMCPVKMVDSEFVCFPETGRLGLAGSIPKSFYFWRPKPGHFDGFINSFHPLALQYLNSTHSELVFVPPLCFENARLRVWRKFLLYDKNFTKILFSCKYTSLGVFINSDVLKMSLYNVEIPDLNVDIPVPASLTSWYNALDHTIFYQNCSIFKAYCYNFITKFPFYELYSCAPRCDVQVLESYDVVWYMRWYASFVNLFKMETFVYFVKMIFRALGQAIWALISWAFDIAMIVLQGAILTLTATLDGVIELGMLEVILLILLLYSHYSLVFAVVVAACFLLLRFMVEHFIHNIS